MTKPVVSLYCDGSCKPNPGIGGYGIVLVHESSGRVRWEYGHIGQTTNNQAELLAAIEGLKLLHQPCAVTIYSDSKWLVNTGAMNWKRNARYIELWLELDRLCQPHDMDWQWVRGHDLHPENTKADQLAQMGRMANEK